MLSSNRESLRSIYKGRKKKKNEKQQQQNGLNTIEEGNMISQQLYTTPHFSMKKILLLKIGMK